MRMCVCVYVTQCVLSANEPWLFISNMTNLSLIRLFWSQIDLFDLHLMTFFTTWFFDLFIVIIIIWLLLVSFLCLCDFFFFWFFFIIIFTLAFVLVLHSVVCIWYLLFEVGAFDLFKYYNPYRPPIQLILIRYKWYWWFINRKKTVIVTSKCCLFNFLEVDFNVR